MTAFFVSRFAAVYGRLRNCSRSTITSFIFILTFIGILAGHHINPVRSAGAPAASSLTIYEGEPVRLDGSDDTTFWATGDGHNVENIPDAPHVYMNAGSYTAVSNGPTGAVAVNVLPIPVPEYVQTLIDTGDPARNKTQFQEALNRAALDSRTNEILIPAGFVMNDTVNVPARSASTYVTVRTMSDLPENTRIVRADSPKLFRINHRGAGVSGYNYGLGFDSGAKYYRFIGMEVRTVQNTAPNDQVRIMNNAANNHIVFDRCLFDGNGFEVYKGLVLNGEYISVLNSSILDIKAKGTETKAIANWSGAGPIAVVNSHLEAASINTLIGGSDPATPADMLNGYVFRGNLVTKNPAWQGAGYAMKNLFEIKHGSNIVAVGNVFENNYADAQAGAGILLKSQAHGTNAAIESSYVDFRLNKLLNSHSGINMAGAMSDTSTMPVPLNHVSIRHNVIEVTGGYIFQMSGEPMHEVHIDHNTAVRAVTHVLSLDIAARSSGFRFTNNFLPPTTYGVKGSGAGAGTASFNYAFTDYDVRRNVFFGQMSSAYPSDNFFPTTDYTFEFANFVGGDYTMVGSYRGTAADGSDVGADMSLLSAAVAPAYSGLWRTVNNAILPAPTPAPIPTVTPTPVPSPTASPSPSPTPLPSDGASPSPSSTDWINIQATSSLFGTVQYSGSTYFGMAKSRQVIRNSAYFEWIYDAASPNVLVGLGNSNDEVPDSGSKDLSYSFDGNLVRELGVYRSEFNLVNGDRLRIEIDNRGNVLYKRNGRTVYRSKRRASGNYYLVFKSQETVGSKIINANFNGVNYGS